MGTISKDIAEDVMTGKYSEDNPVKIITYNNMFDGGLTFAVVFIYENFSKYEQSPACHNVRTVWTKPHGLTPYGQTLMNSKEGI